MYICMYICTLCTQRTFSSTYICTYVLEGRSFQLELSDFCICKAIAAELFQSKVHSTAATRFLAEVKLAKSQNVEIQNARRKSKC
jgi:hypothetical protein